MSVVGFAQPLYTAFEGDEAVIVELRVVLGGRELETTITVRVLSRPMTANGVCYIVVVELS